MTEEKKQPESSLRLFTSDGKPLRVLSTSLGIALLANVVLSTGVSATSGTSTTEQPKLVSWSSEEVKAYFDSQVDWSLPLTSQGAEQQCEDNANGQNGCEEPAAETQTGGQTNVVHHYNSGFGWDDLLLYHLLFNSGGSYSSSGYYKSRPAYYSSSKNKYTPKTYSSDQFQNKQVAGTTVKPKTSSSTGSVTRRTTSSSPGGIGGKSSSLSSSGSSSKSSSSGSKSSTSSSKSSVGSSSKSSGFGG